MGRDIQRRIGGERGKAGRGRDAVLTEKYDQPSFETQRLSGASNGRQEGALNKGTAHEGEGKVVR